MARYADDLIVTDKSKRILEETIQPAIESFLAERGLTLSKEKTVNAYVPEFRPLGASKFGKEKM